MNEKNITWLITALTLLSAIFFAAGQVYYQGYLGEYGLDDALLVQAREKSILNGAFLLIMGITASLPIVNLLLYGLIALVLIIALTPTHRIDISKILPLEKIKCFKISLSKANFLENLLNKLIFIPLYALVLLMVYVLATAAISNTLNFGKTSARDEKALFAKGQGKIILLSAQGFDTPIRAKQITCGDQYCAFWLGDKALVLKAEKIEQLQTEPKP